MKVHWGRVVVAAILFEAVLFAITIVLTLFMDIQAFLPYVPPLVFVVGFPFGMWVARKPASGFVLHGVLVGVVATIIYFGLVVGQGVSVTEVMNMYGPIPFFLANALKILGCVAGAYVAGRRRA